MYVRLAVGNNMADIMLGIAYELAIDKVASPLQWRGSYRSASTACGIVSTSLRVSGARFKEVPGYSVVL